MFVAAMPRQQPGDKIGQGQTDRAANRGRFRRLLSALGKGHFHCFDDAHLAVHQGVVAVKNHQFQHGRGSSMPPALLHRAG